MLDHTIEELMRAQTTLPPAPVHPDMLVFYVGMGFAVFMLMSGIVVLIVEHFHPPKDRSDD